MWDRLVYELLALCSAHLGLPKCWDYRCEPLHLVYFYFLETGSHFVAQAGLELLSSTDSPDSTSQVLGLQVRAITPTWDHKFGL